MKLIISPSRLKILRERSELSITGLAKKLESLKRPVTTRTISDIEKDKSEKRPINENTLKSLSKALGVPPSVLSGEDDLPAKHSPGDPISVQLDAQTQLNYDLLAQRYGVSVEDIINIAPVLFIKAAVESLSRQKRVLEEDVFEEIRKISRMPGEQLPHSLDAVPEGLLEHLDERDYEPNFGSRLWAIKKNDLFEETVPYDFDMFEDRPNPFGYYLKEICGSELGHKKACLLGEDYYGFTSYFPGGRIPRSIVCNEDIEKITLGSHQAGRALLEGIVRIKDIPEEFWEPRRAGDRVAWLEDEYASAQQKAELDGDVSDEVI